MFHPRTIHDRLFMKRNAINKHTNLVSVTRLKEIDPNLDELQHHEGIDRALVEPRLVLRDDLGDVEDDLLRLGEVEVAGLGAVGVEGVDEEAVNVGRALGGLLSAVRAGLGVVTTLERGFSFV